MHADSRKLLWDAQHAAERTITFAKGKTFAQYQVDDLLRSAIERQLTILGEALSQLRQVDNETACAIPELARVVGFRNVLVHGYATVDDRIVWGIVESNLAPLFQTVQRLLADPEPDASYE